MKRKICFFIALLLLVLSIIGWKWCVDTNHLRLAILPIIGFSFNFITCLMLINFDYVKLYTKLFDK